MLEKFLFFILFTLAVMFGLTFWYLIFWFITEQKNLFSWELWVKIIYLLLSLNTTNNIIDFINRTGCKEQ